jgi:IS1 family transposase
MANILPPAKRAAIVSALTEGCSIRSTARMVGVSRNTVTKLLLDLAEACAAYQREHLVDLPCKRVQADEIWSFVYAKAKNVPVEKAGEFGFGDVWTWTALCSDTKLAISWLVGSRDSGVATEFMQDVAGRLAGRVQLTTDGHRPYLEAVEDAFGADVDYAMLQKLYGSSPDAERRYSPAECIGVKVGVVQGDPDPMHVSTSYVERQNLTMRMNMRRFTRLTNAFSKKVENHAAAVELHFMVYNFVRPHGSLRTEKDNRRTPAMAARIARRPWTIEDAVALVDPRI